MKTFLRLAAILAIFVTGVWAGPISVDAGWYGFCFGGAGSAASSGCKNSGIGTSGNSFTFSSGGSTLLKVTDAFDHGDIFDVYVNSVFAFTTSSVASSPGSVGDPDIAFADPLYSSGSTLLAPGSYAVDIFAKVSPFGDGGAYMQVVSASSAVPEPATWGLLASALGLLAAARRLRRS